MDAHTDLTTIKDCWICGSDSESATIVNRSALHIENSIFVPYGTYDIEKARRWIDNYGGTLKLSNNRFGAEPGSRPVVYNYKKGVQNVLNTDYMLARIIMHNNMHFCNNSKYRTAIVLFEMPNLIDFRSGSGGGTDAKYVVTKAETLDVTPYLEYLPKFRINLDYSVFGADKTSISSFVDADLVPFVVGAPVVAENVNIIDRGTQKTCEISNGSGYVIVEKLEEYSLNHYTITYNNYINIAPIVIDLVIQTGSLNETITSATLISAHVTNIATPIYICTDGDKKLLVIKRPPGSSQKIYVSSYRSKLLSPQNYEGDTLNLTPIQLLGNVVGSSFPEGIAKEGYCVFNTQRHRPYWYKDGKWIDATGAEEGVYRTGTKEQRPDFTTKAIPVGYVYMQQSGGVIKPIWWTGSKWVDATGTNVDA